MGLASYIAISILDSWEQKWCYLLCLYLYYIQYASFIRGYLCSSREFFTAWLCVCFRAFSALQVHTHPVVATSSSTTHKPRRTPRAITVLWSVSKLVSESLAQCLLKNVSKCILRCSSIWSQSTIHKTVCKLAVHTTIIINSYDDSCIIFIWYTWCQQSVTDSTASEIEGYVLTAVVVKTLCELVHVLAVSFLSSLFTYVRFIHFCWYQW